MRTTTLLVLFGVPVACGPGDPASSPTDTDATASTADTGDVRQGACGDTFHHTLEFLGAVVMPDGSDAVGASVRLEERTYHPRVRIYGKGTLTDANGHFGFVAEDIVEVEDCWGTLVNYYMVAELDDLHGEDSINSSMFNAVRYETPVDLTMIPIVLNVVK